jgi:hypothetical protein
MGNAVVIFDRRYPVSPSDLSADCDKPAPVLLGLAKKLEKAYMVKGRSLQTWLIRVAKDSEQTKPRVGLLRPKDRVVAHLIQEARHDARKELAATLSSHRGRRVCGGRFVQ